MCVMGCGEVRERGGRRNKNGMKGGVTVTKKRRKLCEHITIVPHKVRPREIEHVIE